ncbi:HdeD family acid-resistance protein [Palleronia caenipelagi]|uniref:HdeD family acid-resistance protein n=1 Tax=Palleronia caenipelagi TaxID=2489174 RepID=A0A547Q5S0_9RHOB|nr:HdeD family acid-resistance protein [Palleronia caenipelagi]TRD21735.1 HdeD family acid-resistance protein [Palleronia caenipelagi]
MANTETKDFAVTEEAKLNWKWMIFMGVVMTLGGLASLIYPFIASLTVTFMAAAAFFVGGIMQTVLAIRAEDGSTGARWTTGLLGVLMVLLALALWFDPLAGLVTLTLTVAALFIAMGALRAWFAFRMKPRKGWGWVLVAGLLSIGLGLFVLLNMPFAAATTLGILLGIDLTMTGAALIGLGLASRN